MSTSKRDISLAAQGVQLVMVELKMSQAEQLMLLASLIGESLAMVNPNHREFVRGCVAQIINEQMVASLIGTPVGEA